MINRTFDGTVVRWFDCVARNSHRFNGAGTCMDCGAERRGPAVQIRGGGVPRREQQRTPPRRK